MSLGSHARIPGISAAVYRRLLYLYPTRTRRAFGEELGEIAETLLKEAYGRGGSRAVARLWPRLLVDTGNALACEYFDLWRGSRFGPRLFVCACLLGFAAVWALIVAASVFDSRWAARLLNFNALLTMLLAFGLPLVALGASRIRPPPDLAGPAVCAASFRLSAAATIASWSALVLHLA